MLNHIFTKASLTLGAGGALSSRLCNCPPDCQRHQVGHQEYATEMRVRREQCEVSGDQRPKSEKPNIVVGVRVRPYINCPSLKKDPRDIFASGDE